MKTTLPIKMKAFFWDVPFYTLSPKKHSKYIIERILRYGDLSDIGWLTKTYKKTMIKEICHKSKNLSNKTKNFWSIWFKGKHEKEQITERTI
jgi:hypothetical protein